MEKKLKEELEKIEIPTELMPDAVVERLKQEKRSRKIYNMKHVKTILACAAGLALVIGICTVASNGAFLRRGDVVANNDNMSAQQEDVILNEEFVRNHSVGNLYTLADSYQQIKQVVRRSLGKYHLFAENKDTAQLELSNDVMVEASELASEQVDYSKTNLLVEGVEESDYVKTDGERLYYIYDNKCYILNIKNEQRVEAIIEMPQEVATEEGVLTEEIHSLFIDENRVYLLTNQWENPKEWVDGGFEILEDAKIAIDVAGCYPWYRTNEKTILHTYDISDASSPKEIGKVTLDGSYLNARKTDGYIYLFSNYYMGDAVYEKDRIVPTINEVKIDCDCVYIRQGGSSQILMTSVDVTEPSKCKDAVSVMGDSGQMYMGKEAIYIWNTKFDSDREVLEIAKFSYKDGRINGENACELKGYIPDEFAISEQGGELRVLTTAWEEEATNQLYILNEKMQVIGQIEHIADGENIYAARFLKDRAYLVTYLNHDPLFVIDLKDSSNPKILGQLEISGYSDYLHMYGDHLVLGIGYETDEETSECLGVKLTMFDCSNPTEPVVLDTVICEQYQDLGWGELYKQLLVDPGKNLIGFGAGSYHPAMMQGYELYSFNGEKFEHIFSETSKDSQEDANWSMYRGLYCGNDFILVRDASIYFYDMSKEYAKTKEVILSK